jgi:CspA family cold shock protein
MTGYIKKLVAERGFGFITAQDGTDVFFHRSQTAEFDELREGDDVSFEVEANEKGPRALGVALAQAVTR